MVGALRLASMSPCELFADPLLYSWNGGFFASSTVIFLNSGFFASSTVIFSELRISSTLRPLSYAKAAVAMRVICEDKLFYARELIIKSIWLLGRWLEPSRMRNNGVLFWARYWVKSNDRFTMLPALRKMFAFFHFQRLLIPIPKVPRFCQSPGFPHSFLMPTSLDWA